MPKSQTSRSSLPAPVQLPLFPEEASLIRIRPERNQWRYYRLAVCPPPAIPSDFAGRNLGPAPPDLFGRTVLARHWGGAGQGSASASWRNAGRGRIGTPGRIRLDPHPDHGAALNALARLARTKRRRGYRDRAA